MAYTQPNNDIIVPFDSLPPSKLIKFEIQCKHFEHRDQKVQYLILKKSSDILKTRLACIKCIQGPLSVCQQDIALLEDIAKDPFNLLKFTKYQLNEYQQFSDLYHSFDFSFDKNMIEFKFNKMKEQILYELGKCKLQILNQFDKYFETKKQFDRIKSSLSKTFDFSTVLKELEIFSNAGNNPAPKKWNAINGILEKYVQQFHQKDTDEVKTLNKDLEYLKKSLSSKEQLLLQKHKLDQGAQNILNSIYEMKKTFDQRLFIKSELSNDYIQVVLERIDPKYQNFDEVHQISKLYSSFYQELSYQKILKAISIQPKHILFIFKTNSDQRFGVFVAPSEFHKNFIFSLSKNQIYPILSLSQQHNQPAKTPAINSIVNPPPGPISRQTMLSPPQNSNSQNLNFSLNHQPNFQQLNGQTLGLANPPQMSGSLYTVNNGCYINSKANDKGEFIKFGNQDLVIMSDFNDCKSKLGICYDISGHNIGNVEMHLANAQNFQIVGLEIFGLQ